MIILDGGLGRELKAMGAPFRQPEWSALALMEGPDFVRAAHDAFIEAGADIITTNSYSIVPFHIGEAAFRNRAGELLDLAGQLAKSAAKPGGLYRRPVGPKDGRRQSTLPRDRTSAAARRTAPLGTPVEAAPDQRHQTLRQQTRGRPNTPGSSDP